MSDWISDLYEWPPKNVEILSRFKYFKNVKTGKVHDFFVRDDKTIVSRCGIKFSEGDPKFEEVAPTEPKDPTACKNCKYPGHGNLWKDDYEDYTIW